jgi:hypothetical protein
MNSIKRLVWVLGLCTLWSVTLQAQQPITTRELQSWQLLGSGSSAAFQEAIYLKESDTSKGVMLLSPGNFPSSYLMRFEMVPLTSSTVMIAVLNASDAKGSALSIPSGYDGSMGIWTSAITSYFVAFRNAPHASTPFITKQPGVKTVKAEQYDDMLAGKRYQVELGVKGNLVWLKVDGKKLVEFQDPNPLPAGRMAFRLRGLPGLPAACLIYNVSLQTL